MTNNNLAEKLICPLEERLTEEEQKFLQLLRDPVKKQIILKMVAESLT
jgi:hypothetical protein